MTSEDHLSLDFTSRVGQALKEESDRACIILAAAWADYILQIKLKREFAQGNAKARQALFSPNGPFCTFSAKINLAFCADWIKSDLYNDLQVLRRLRNHFAHSIQQSDLHDSVFLAR